MVVDGSLGTLYVDAACGPRSGAGARGLHRRLGRHLQRLFRPRLRRRRAGCTGQEIEEVYADGGVLGFDVFAKYDDVDTAVATLRLSGGTLAILSTTRHDPLGYDIRTELFGSGDSVSVGLGPRTPMRSLEPGVPPPAGPAWSAFMDRFHDAYAEELRAFLRVARGEEESACTARDGLEAVRVAVAATRSLREHRPVRVVEVT